MNGPKFRQFIDGEFWYWGYRVNADPAEFVPPKDPTKPSEQWVGLTDKNGTKIYAGDLVEFKLGPEKVVGIVSYDPASARYIKSFVSSYGREEKDLSSYASSQKVVGNIHENPGPLK